MREEQKKVIQKEIDRLEHLGIIRKGLTGYSSLVVLVKRKNQNLYRVCCDFWILNEKLLKINHAFPLVSTYKGIHVYTYIPIKLYNYIHIHICMWLS